MFFNWSIRRLKNSGSEGWGWFDDLSVDLWGLKVARSETREYVPGGRSHRKLAVLARVSGRCESHAVAAFPLPLGAPEEPQQKRGKGSSHSFPKQHTGDLTRVNNHVSLTFIFFYHYRSPRSSFPFESAPWRDAQMPMRSSACPVPVVFSSCRRRFVSFHRALLLIGSDLVHVECPLFLLLYLERCSTVSATALEADDLVSRIWKKLMAMGLFFRIWRSTSIFF